MNNTAKTRIIIAPDKFKASMSAAVAAAMIAEGLRVALPDAELIQLPLSDGGEGLVESLAGKEGKLVSTMVSDPLGKPVEATWALINGGQTAVIEMASASGLYLLREDEKNPLLTSTYGTGELIKAALECDCSKIILGIGGSATTDGGAGMAQALGVKLIDRHGNSIGKGGLELLKLADLDLKKLDRRLAAVEILAACDVNNPLTGPEGAAYVYGPQKGATQEMVKQLDRALVNYAALIKKKLGMDIDKTPGSGAAGGLGAGLIAFLGARLIPGIDLVLDTIQFDQHLVNCDLLITGEGKMDSQTLRGKAPFGVAKRAKNKNIPVVALAGSIEGPEELFFQAGIQSCFAIAGGPITLEESIEKGPSLLKTTAVRVARLWNAGRTLKKADRSNRSAFN